MFPTPHSTCSCASNSVIRQEELAVLTGSGNRLPRSDGGSEERRATPYPSQRGRAKGHSVPSFPLGCAGQWSRITFHLLLYQPIGYPSGKYNKGGIKHTWACSLLLQGIVTPSLRRQHPSLLAGAQLGPLYRGLAHASSKISRPFSRVEWLLSDFTVFLV